MGKPRSNSSNMTARRHAKATRGIRAGKNGMGSAARRPGKTSRIRNKDKKPKADNREILRTRKISTHNTKSTS
jgi:hypothetical protein